jgi:DNA-3-methyladenine glycosylase II
MDFVMADLAKGDERSAGASFRKTTSNRKSGRKSASKRKEVSQKTTTRGRARTLQSKQGKAKRRRSVVAPALNLYHPGPLIDSGEALNAAIDRLLALDAEVVGKLLAHGGRPSLRKREPGLAGLAWIIVSQQVSTASANAIFKRLETNLSPLSVARILAADDDGLRACGLSLAKMRALRALAEAIESKALDLAALGSLTAEEAHRALVAVKGIGPWTADIFLLFCLGHPDAFPAGDLALQEAARAALGLKRRPDVRNLQKIAERWRPLRGVAARMLWAYYRFTRQGREGMALAGG